MKIYPIEIIELKNLVLKTFLKDITIINSKEDVKYYYSLEGIFILVNNNLKRIKITDGKFEKLCINKNYYIKDYSYLTYINTNKLPYQYIYKKKTVNTIKMVDSESSICLVIENDIHDKITDIYFYIKDNYYGVEEDIKKYLNIIYKYI